MRTGFTRIIVVDLPQILVDSGADYISICVGDTDSFGWRRFILVQEIVDSDARIGGAGGSFS